MDQNQLDLLDSSQSVFEGDFEEQAKKLLSIVRMTKSEVEDLTKLFNEIDHVFQTVWPNCTIMPFGSVVSGLGIQSSDVDIYAEVPKSLHDTEKSCVKKARNILRWKENFKELTTILTAKVPILKFFHLPTQRHCDINFKSPAGVCNSHLIGLLMQMDARVLPLTVLIKYWSKVHQLTGTHLMPSYCLIMMVIFYLQQNGILPSVESLQENIEPVMVEGWNTAFNRNYEHVTTNDDGMYKLLGEFFVYYSNFDYNENIVSPFTGYVIDKTAFKENLADSLNNTFHLYYQHLRYKKKQNIKLETAMCVQDPFDHSRNCAVAVFPRLGHRILAHFKFAQDLYLTRDRSEFLEHLLKTKVPYVEEKVTPPVAPCRLQIPSVQSDQRDPIIVNQNSHTFSNKIKKRSTNYYNPKRDRFRRRHHPATHTTSNADHKR